MAVPEQLRMRNVSILRKKLGLSLPGYRKEEYLYNEQDGYHRDCRSWYSF